MATAYRNVAARIGVDLFTSAAIREATRGESSRILAGQEDKWTPLFNEIAKYLYEWQTAEQRDRVEYQTMWQGIAAGFDLSLKGKSSERK